MHISSDKILFASFSFSSLEALRSHFLYELSVAFLLSLSFSFTPPLSCYLHTWVLPDHFNGPESVS